jgi:hypothetical protein
MTVTYRTSGAWGSGKGTNLTPAEVDGNFWDHEGRIVTLEGGLPAPNEIADISVDANGMITFTMDDATAFGPYQIPIAAFGWRGDWLASTAYNLYDIVHVAGACRASPGNRRDAPGAPTTTPPGVSTCRT